MTFKHKDLKDTETKYEIGNIYKLCDVLTVESGRFTFRYDFPILCINETHFYVYKIRHAIQFDTQ